MQDADAPSVPYAPDPLDVPLAVWLARATHGISPESLTLAYADWAAHAALSPSHQARLAASAWRKALQWTQYVAQGWTGDCPLCVSPAPNDKRFVAPEWDKAPYNYLAQAFLLTQQWWDEATVGVRGVSRHHQEVAEFTARQWLDMCSPANFVATNPQLLQETLQRGGANLVSGGVNWWRDAATLLTDGQARGVEDFAPGKGTALSPGKVVFRNALIELIQYEPTTEKVAAEPVLIVPSWIMKYYILDLTPDDSLVRYLVDQGHTVFMVSWKNPGRAERDLSMDDYVSLGVLAAVHATQSIRRQAAIHAVGYCLGGTLLAIAAALLGASGDSPFKTVSLLAAQVDFHEPGELGLFIDEGQIAFLEGLMAEHGYLDGRQMAGAFQLINSKDLVWSKLVHEYLMGARTPMTAMKAWNADATRLPSRMHSEYLRRLYLHNDLAEGRYRVRGRVVRLTDITVPLFVAATQRDHVSPWTSVYKIHQLAHAPVEFVLSSGGHNVGIVNPPEGPLAHPSASYQVGAHELRRAPADAHEWLDGAITHNGSWWPRWAAWLARHGEARRVPAAPVKALMAHGAPLAAPGTYVHQR
jgi:polyhydroxyalkanoate synthase